jgi:Spy/CpxP family protein refolding chaperone
MRVAVAGLIAVAALALCQWLYADDEPQGANNAIGMTEHMQDLSLTDEQETKIKDIRKEYGPKVQEAGKELASIVKEETEKVRGMLTSEQLEKVEAFREERKEHRVAGLCERVAHLKELDLTNAEKAQIERIRDEYRPKMAQAMEGLKGLLTNDQKKEREEALRAGKTRREVWASLNLTEDQKAKMEATGKEVRTLFHEELEQMKNVLSSGQQEKLAELKDERMDRIRDRWAGRISNFRGLNLSDEQKSKLADIRTEFRPKIHEAGNKLRAAVREEIDAILMVLKG